MFSYSFGYFNKLQKVVETIKYLKSMTNICLHFKLSSKISKLTYKSAIHMFIFYPMHFLIIQVKH